MAINNTYFLDVDIKRGMTSKTPTFRKGDNAVLIFRVFDDGVEFPMNRITSAEVWHETQYGNVIKSPTRLTSHEGRVTITHYYDKTNMIETGIVKTMLVMYENTVAVAVQPFPVIIYTDMQSGANSFIELLQMLQSRINNLILDLSQTIKLREKGVPNGVATLDASGKIPQSQLPPHLEAYIKHIPQTVWKNQVHGMRIDKDGILQYDTGNNSWQNVGFAPSAVGGGGSGTQLLDVTITKSNSIANVKYVGVPTVTIQKWAVGDRDKIYFASNGNTFTGNTFPITQLGIHTLYYKDSNGVEYTKTFNVAVSDLTAPTITVDVNNGDVTVNISVGTSIKKWAKGKQTIGYFQSQGAVFTGNTFKVTEVGWYTIYYKTTAGVEYTREFEVDFRLLGGSLPIITRSDVVNSDSDKKYRAFMIGINDNRVTMVKFTGRYNAIGGTDYSRVFEEEGYRYSNGTSGYIDITSTSHNMTVEFLDDNGVVYGTAVHKCRSDYNYLVVNNQYVSLTRIKNSTVNYIVPSTIEGLPVLDVGCIFFTNAFKPDNPYDNWKAVNVTLPPSVITGGRFIINTINSSLGTVEKLRIENPDFKLSDTFAPFWGNVNGGIRYEAPLNSDIYNYLVTTFGTNKVTGF